MRPPAAERFDLLALKRWAQTAHAPGRRWPPLLVAEIQELNDALTQLGRQDRIEAMRLARALVVRADGSSLEVRALARRTRGHLLRGLRRYRAALRDYQWASATLRAGGFYYEEARTAIGMLDALAALGEIEGAVRLATRAKAVFARAGDQQRLARLEVNLGNLRVRQGRLQQAHGHYRRSEQLFGELGLPLDRALARFNVGTVCEALDQPTAALSAYEESVEAFRGLDQPVLTCGAQLAQANVLARLGRTADAIRVLETASSVAGGLGDEPLRASADAKQARLRMRLGLDPAEPLERVVERLDRLAMVADAAELLLLEAALHRSRGALDLAESDVVSALRRLHRFGDRPRQLSAKLELVRLALDHRRVQDARASLLRMVQTCRRLGLQSLEAEARLGLAEALIGTNRPQARAHLRRAASQLRRVGDPWLVPHIALLQARLFASAGREPAAMRALDVSWRELERLRRSMPLELMRAGFLGAQDELYGEALALTFAAGRADRALRWSERAHAPHLRDAVLWDSLSSMQDAQAMRRMERLRGRLFWLDERIRQDRLSAIAPDQGLRIRRAKAVRAISQTFAHLELEHAQRVGIRPPREWTTADVRRALPNHALGLQYVVGRQAVYVVRVGQERLDQVCLRIHPGRLEERVYRLKRLWARWRLGEAFVTRHREALQLATDALLRELFDELLGPVLEGVPARELIIAPHRSLHGLPFHALLGPLGPVAFSHELRYLPSLGALLTLPPTGRTRGPALVVGLASPEAPEAEAEAETVARFYPDADLLQAGAATRAQVATRWGGARLIHVSSHAGLDSSDPRLSGVRLADGTWSAYDLYRHPTRADVVVLSGCETGAVHLGGSDGVMGLVPALFQTGARTVIASLWSVDDRTTRRTMELVHTALLEGFAPRAALTRAWRLLQHENPSGFHWAPFALFGAS